MGADRRESSIRCNYPHARKLAACVRLSHAACPALLGLLQHRPPFARQLMKRSQPLFSTHITAASVHSCPRALLARGSLHETCLSSVGRDEEGGNRKHRWQQPNRLDKLPSNAASPPPFAAAHVRPAHYQMPADAWQQRLLVADSEDVLCRILVQEGAALSAAQTVEAWQLLLRQYANAQVAAGEGAGGRGEGGHGHLFAQSLALLAQNLARQMAKLTFSQLSRLLQALVYAGIVVDPALLSALDLHLREAAARVEARNDLRGVAVVLWAYGVAQRLDTGGEGGEEEEEEEVEEEEEEDTCLDRHMALLCDLILVCSTAYTCAYVRLISTKTAKTDWTSKASPTCCGG
jgi:hypothetical protein